MDDLLEEESLSEDDSVSEEYGSSEEDDSESSSRSKGAIQPVSPNVGPAESPRQQTLTFVPRAAIQRERERESGVLKSTGSHLGRADIERKEVKTTQRTSP